MKNIIFILLLVFSYYSFGQNSKESEIRLALDFYETKDYNNAIIHFKNHLKIFSNDYSAMLSLAFCYDKINDCENAIKIYDKIIKIKTNHDIAYLFRAVDKYILGKRLDACNDLYLAIGYGNKQAEEYLKQVCPDEEYAYRQLPNCSNINDLNKWIEFVEAYPSSKHIDKSFNSVFEMYFFNINKNIIDSWTKIDDYNPQIFIDYVKYFPNGSQIKQMNAETIKSNLVRNELPVCTKMEHLNKWEKFINEHPNSEYVNMTLFDLYYYQVMLDVIATAPLKMIEDASKLEILLGDYSRIFPNGIYKEQLSNTIKEIQIVIKKAKDEQERRRLEIERKYQRKQALRRARQREREREREEEAQEQRKEDETNTNSSSTSVKTSDFKPLSVISVVVDKFDYCYGKCDRYLVTFNQDVHKNADPRWSTFDVNKNQIHVFRFKKDGNFCYSSAVNLFNTSQISRTIHGLKLKLENK